MYSTSGSISCVCSISQAPETDLVCPYKCYISHAILFSLCYTVISHSISSVTNSYIKNKENTAVILPGPRGITFTWWGCCCFCFWRKPTKLAHSFLFRSCVRFCLYGPFNRISFHKLSWQLSAFLLRFPRLILLCSSGLISTSVVLSTIFRFTKNFLQPWCDPLWLTELKAPTTYLLCLCLVHRYFDIAFIPSVWSRCCCVKIIRLWQGQCGIFYRWG